jgi:MoxR-like ATPase
MLNVLVDYNSLDEEFEIVKRVAQNSFGVIQKVANKDDLAKLKEEVNRVHIDDGVLKYILEIVFATRDPKSYDLGELAEYIEYGASPRASINIYKASKALALLNGKDYVTPLEVATIVPDVLRHRIILNYKAEAASIGSDEIIKKIMQTIIVP